MGTIGMIAVYAVFFGVIWFLFMRPQKKEQQRIQLMLKEMEVGDTVLTTSGFYGVLIDISEDDVIVELHGDKEDLKSGVQEMGSFFLEQ